MSTLASSHAFSGFSVADSEQAQRFYGETLGLHVEPIMEMDGLFAIHLKPGIDVLVYEKGDHIPATYTVLNFPVEDVDAAVDELTAKGVNFLHYDGFDQDERGIARGNPTIAWFTDPSGNILAILNET